MKLDFKLAEAYHGTTMELDGVIHALGGTYPPIDPTIHPQTIIWFNRDGTIITKEEYDIIGELDESYARYQPATKIEIGTNVTSIGEEAFTSCDKLFSVNIPSTVLSIKQFAFHSNLMLDTLIIPKTVSTIENPQFYGCPTTVTFEGRTKADVQQMTGFPWYIQSGKIICTDGTL